MLVVGQPLYAAVAFAGCYLLGALSALVSAAVLRRTLVKGTARPMVLELPSYKVPSFTNALISARDQGFAFLKTAGTIIMAICVVMWWLSAYPTAGAAPEAVALQQRAAATADPAAAKELLAEADSTQARAQQQQSFAGRLGRLAQPVFAPLGYDWQLTVGVLTSFLAREVFVSTMSVLLGGSDDPDLADTFHARTQPLRRPLERRMHGQHFLHGSREQLRLRRKLVANHYPAGPFRHEGLLFFPRNTIQHARQSDDYQGNAPVELARMTII
jgi:ferrous iron transport protein B